MGITQNDIITPYYAPHRQINCSPKRSSNCFTIITKHLRKKFLIGINTNTSFPHQICGTQPFKEAKIHTTLVEAEISRILKKELLPDEILLIACFTELQQ